MNQMDVFWKIAAGSKFDFKRFQSDAEKLKIRKVNANVNSVSDVVQVADQCIMASAESKESLKLQLERLRVSIADATALTEFDKLYREKTGMSFSAAKLPANRNKNRYGDILPYDETRVKLNASQNYINANNVEMVISGIRGKNQSVRRYIAMQGPLPNTVDDFWQCVWDHNVSHIVMLTSEMEKGVVKCHRYWPSATHQSTKHGPLTVEFIEEKKTKTTVIRKFKLSSSKASSNGSRIVNQFQYLGWPDHGVPGEHDDFLYFVNFLLQKCGDFDGPHPTIIHCSAGVGRTGVFIGLVTALHKMKAGQSFQALDFVKQMRDQRGGCVQTTEQFKFMCEAILKVYDALQKLFEIVEEDLTALEMTINPSKSACIRFGPRYEAMCANITANDGSPIPWTKSIKYLERYNTNNSAGDSGAILDSEERRPSAAMDDDISLPSNSNDESSDNSSECDKDDGDEDEDDGSDSGNERLDSVDEESDGECSKEDSDSDNDMDCDIECGTVKLAKSRVNTGARDKKSSEKKTKKKKVLTAEQKARIHQEEINHFRNVNNIHVYGTDIPEPIKSFEELESVYSINSKLVENIRSSKYVTPTVIEMQAMPVMLHRRELMACAPTGSGKTLAFVLPVLHHLGSPRKDGFRALCLAPTRELAEQTCREFNRIGEGTGLKVRFMYSAADDLEKFGAKLFHKFDILVTTPNRLVYLLQQEKTLSLSSVQWLVVDESDKLFEDGKTGFREQLATIYKACDSKDVRRAMFSATFSYDVEEWCKLNLDNVVQVYIGARNSVAKTIEQKLLYVGDESGKLLAVRDIIQKGFQPPMLIFVQSKDRAKELFQALAYDGVRIDVIHADKTQTQRDNLVRAFRSGDIWVLICTDVMCRGMDFKAVNIVVNYDFPNSDYVYIHRIGRTGRAGRNGKAITFFTDSDSVNLRCIANKMREAGCEVPDYMLKMKAPNRQLKRKLEKTAVKRERIFVDVTAPQKKKRKTNFKPKQKKPKQSL